MKHGTEWDDPTADAVVLIDQTKERIRRNLRLAALCEASGKKGIARQYEAEAAVLLASIPSDFWSGEGLA